MHRPPVLAHTSYGMDRSSPGPFGVLAKDWVNYAGVYAGKSPFLGVESCNQAPSHPNVCEVLRHTPNTPPNT